MEFAGPVFIEEGYRCESKDGQSRGHVRVCPDCKAVLVGGLP